MRPPCHCQGLVIHSGVQRLSCTNALPCSESCLFQLLPFLLPLFIYSANINCTSLFCALCKNSKINKRRLLSSRHFQSRGTIFMVIIFSCFLLSLTFHNLHLTILFWAQLSLVPQSCHTHCTEFILSNTGPGHPDASQTSSSSAIIRSQSGGSRISDFSSFLPSHVIPSLLPWLLGSSCSIQLAFTARLPCSLPCLLHNGRDYLITWIWVEQDEVPSWEPLSSKHILKPGSWEASFAPCLFQSFPLPAAKTHHDSSKDACSHLAAIVPEILRKVCCLCNIFLPYCM